MGGESLLLKNIRGFLLELGGDFSFQGNQFRLVVEDEEFFIDLLGIATYSTNQMLPEYFKSFLPDPETMARSIDRWLQ